MEGTFGHSWRLGRVGSIEIRIDPSWAFLAVLIAYSFFLRYEALHRDRLSDGGAFLLAVGSAVVFFSSVLIHELAHSFMARRRGIPVKSITLFLFGGATHADMEARGRRPMTTAPFRWSTTE